MRHIHYVAYLLSISKKLITFGITQLVKSVGRKFEPLTNLTIVIGHNPGGKSPQALELIIRPCLGFKIDNLI